MMILCVKSHSCQVQLRAVARDKTGCISQKKFVSENQLSRWNSTGSIQEDENVKFMLLSSAAAQTPCTTPTDLVSAG